jgi:hypothetical protein
VCKLQVRLQSKNKVGKKGKSNVQTLYIGKRGKRLKSIINIKCKIQYYSNEKERKKTELICKEKMRIRRNNNICKRLHEVSKYKRYRYVKSGKYGMHCTVNTRVSIHRKLAPQRTKVRVNSNTPVCLYSHSTREMKRDKTYVKESSEKRKCAKCVKVKYVKPVVMQYNASKRFSMVYVIEKIYVVYNNLWYKDSAAKVKQPRGKNETLLLLNTSWWYGSVKKMRYPINAVGRGMKVNKEVMVSLRCYGIRRVVNIIYGQLSVLSEMSAADRGEDDGEMADPALPGGKGACCFINHSCKIKSYSPLEIVNAREFYKMISCRAVISLDCINYNIADTCSCNCNSVIRAVDIVQMYVSSPCSIAGKNRPGKKRVLLEELSFICWCGRYGE